MYQFLFVFHNFVLLSKLRKPNPNMDISKLVEFRYCRHQQTAWLIMRSFCFHCPMSRQPRRGCWGKRKRVEVRVRVDGQWLRDCLVMLANGKNTYFNTKSHFLTTFCERKNILLSLKSIVEVFQTGTKGLRFWEWEREEMEAKVIGESIIW